MTERNDMLAADSARTVRRLREGDPEATCEVRRKVRRILAFRGYGIPAEDRLDLEQVIMTQLWRAVNRIDFESKGFWGLVEVVASRRCIDWRRAHRPETALDTIGELIEPRTTPLEQLLQKEDSQRGRTVLTRLPRSCRELVALYAGRGLSYREIANILGVREATLRVRMHRCIKRAKLILDQVSKKR